MLITKKMGLVVISVILFSVTNPDNTVESLEAVENENAASATSGTVVDIRSFLRELHIIQVSKEICLI